MSTEKNKLPVKKGSTEKTRKMASLGIGLLGKKMLRELIKWMHKLAPDWDCEPEDLLMMLRTKNGKPDVMVAETKNNNRHNFTGKLGSMEDLVNLAFSKLLKAVDKTAQMWGCDREDVVMTLRVKDGNPEVRISEMKGEKRFIDLVY